MTNVRPTLALSGLLTLLAACGDDSNTSATAPSADTGPADAGPLDARLPSDMNPTPSDMMLTPDMGLECERPEIGTFETPFELMGDCIQRDFLITGEATLVIRGEGLPPGTPFVLALDGDNVFAEGVAGDDGALVHVLERVRPGMFRLQVGTPGGSTLSGTFALEQPCAAPFPDLVLSEADQFQSGMLTAESCFLGGPVDLYRFDAAEFSTLALTTRSEAFAATAQVFSANDGQRIAEAGDDLVLDLMPGPYVVMLAGGIGAYAYQAELRRTDCGIDGDVLVDTPIMGSFDLNDCDPSELQFNEGFPDARADVFTFATRRAGFHRFDLSAEPGTELRLTVLDVDGDPMTPLGDDEMYFGSGPELALNLEGGLYTVVATTKPLFEGPYTLAVTRSISPNCPENAETPRLEPPSTLTEAVIWDCEEGIHDIPVFVDTPTMLTFTVSARDGLIQATLIRNREVEQVGLATCTTEEQCSFEAMLEPGVSWLRVRGVVGDRFDVDVQ
ncbi:MAG: hypothetical protein ACE366_25200 [Bradymonadia bacterium]